MAQTTKSSDPTSSLSELLGVTLALGALVALPLAASTAGPALGPVSLAVLTALVFGLILAGAELRRRSMGEASLSYATSSPKRARLVPANRVTVGPARARPGRITSGFNPSRPRVETTQAATG